ncbi:hypothetical protein OE88DRAFT_1668358 [Heliocybe sulcata]|uniref:Uncharacterized protein n=1 Tax=Heliocybe sulcata TaxID=5364 RepID=A0A5C3MMP0_9AGAM|nr:hypothetical protein OE88DRAFT_1668358 [Heliocybe sulcata]
MASTDYAFWRVTASALLRDFYCHVGHYKSAGAPVVTKTGALGYLHSPRRSGERYHGFDTHDLLFSAKWRGLGSRAGKRTCSCRVHMKVW